MEGAEERVNDSVQPVHSWNDSQTTGKRRAFSSPSASNRAAPGGKANKEAAKAQNLRKARRLRPEPNLKSVVLAMACLAENNKTNRTNLSTRPVERASLQLISLQNAAHLHPVTGVLTRDVQRDALVLGARRDHGMMFGLDGLAFIIGLGGPHLVLMRATFRRRHQTPAWRVVLVEPVTTWRSFDAGRAQRGGQQANQQKCLASGRFHDDLLQWVLERGASVIQTSFS
jgi:hypothetical protein